MMTTTFATRPRQTRSKKKRRATPLNAVNSGFHFIMKWDKMSINRNRRKLYHARMILEMTQQQLADKAGIHKGTLINFEDVEGTEQIAPRLRTWLLIIHALGGTCEVTAPTK